MRNSPSAAKTCGDVMQPRDRSAPPRWRSTGDGQAGGERRRRLSASSDRQFADNQSSAPRSKDVQSWVWVSKVAGRVVGSVALTLTGADELTITRLSVAPDYYHTRIVAGLMAQVNQASVLYHRSRILASPGAMPGWLRKSAQQHGVVLQNG